MPSRNDSTWVPRVVWYKVPRFAGQDIIGWKRAVYTVNGDAYSLKKLREQPPRKRMTFGYFFGQSVKKARAGVGLGISSRCDGLLAKKLREAGAVDAFTEWLWDSYAERHRAPEIVYPFPLGASIYVCQWHHQTGGIPGNCAIDFCGPPGSPVLAVEDGVVDRLSGSPPTWDVNDPSGAYGWSTYFTTEQSYRYYVTHQGRRAGGITVGARVKAGQVIGYLGDQDFRLDHIHYGVTSPLGYADACKRISQVAAAPKVVAV